MQNYQKIHPDEPPAGLTAVEIADLLSVEGDEMEGLMARAAAVRDAAIGEGVYLRGLIEYSNICRKECLYCGIRKGNTAVGRYSLTEDEVLRCARTAWESGYGSVVIQGGENQSPEHVRTIERLLREIKSLSGGELGITLSLGEQSSEVYRRWFEAGAHRYLLRIETSDRELYGRIHPAGPVHSFETRLGALHHLRETGYQVGTGVMIGLPGQTVEMLARDLLFMREADIDMCGMGPYVESAATPLSRNPGTVIPPLKWRFDMALKMVAVLRILMPDINIAATTALQAIEPGGRMRAIRAGANVIMPNLTPERYRGDYFLYDNKPLSLDSAIPEDHIRYGEWGDSRHFLRKSKNSSR
ncbi:MAG: [FeFe] hydrogenase H-cluster radical SAM maturase HydE [Alistipes sp.]|nr:[FeFe] hydrogenase H-cluster radical SAM maturase HydE [Alistipes sp.]